MPPRPPLAPAAAVLTRSWAATTATTTRRAASTAASNAADDTSPSAAAPALVYEGPLSLTVTRLKRLSLASCALTTAAAPALATLDAVGGAGHPAVQAGMAAAVATFGAFTTGLLHWFTSPYVHRITLPAAHPDVAVVETLDFFARRRVATLPLATLAPPVNTIHPQATCRAGGPTGKLLYVDLDNFPTDTPAGAALAARLAAVRAQA